MLKWIMHLNRGQFFDTAEMYSIPANENVQEYRAYYRELVEEIRRRGSIGFQNAGPNQISPT
jgi:hypothetical protein